jgi:hypothetical protein
MTASTITTIAPTDLQMGKKYTCEDVLGDTYDLVYQGGDRMFNPTEREIFIIGRDVKHVLKEL